MVLSGKALLVQRTLGVWVFKVVRLIFNCAQTAVWHLTGTAQNAAEAKKPENYERCAQVVNITWWFKFELFAMITMNDFIYTHNRFVSPRYIFDNDDVTLLTVTDEFAVFSENREKGARLWRSKYNSFMRLAQLDHCDKLILVPRDAFHRMAEELGGISGKLVFLFNTARCGSTLLTQILEYTGQCIAISEPDVAYYLSVAYGAQGNTPETRQLSRDSFRWVCRPYKDFKPLTYCVKITGPSIVAIRMFKEAFLDSKCMFMYREPLKVAKSCFKICNQAPMLQIAYFLAQFSANASGLAMDAMGFPGDDFKIKAEDSHTIGIFLVIVASKFYLELLSEGFDVVGVRYEDIVSKSNGAFACKKILDYLGMPESLVSPALEGLKQDSQKESVFSREILAGHKDPEITLKSRQLANSLLRKNGMPILGEDPLLPGTITAPAKLES